MSRLKTALVALLVLLIAAPAAQAQLPGGAPQTAPGGLNRYYSGSTGTHWITPGAVSGDYSFEFSLGFLHTLPGPGRTALYGCRVGASDYMLSPDPGCERQTALGLYGWVDNDRVDDDSVPLYRCWIPGNGTHMASNDAGCEGQTTEFRLGYTRARSNALSRFNGPDHWDSTGAVAGGWSLEAVLGFVLAEGGPNRRPLYECAIGGDHFLSTDAGCEGQRELGLAGHVYGSPPGTEDVVGIYRCLVGSEHFTSNDPRCEGQRTEAQLGYLRRTQEQLYRTYNGSSHWVTTGAIGAGYVYERSLGYVLTRDGTNRTAVFACVAGSADHFLSKDPGCEGQRGEGRIGWLYNSPPAGVETAPVYRCVTDVDHFAATAAGCEGQRNEGLLGYTRTSSPEPPPPPLLLSCGAGGATVSASLRGRAVRRVRFGGRSTIRGRVTDANNAPVPGAQVLILIGDRKPIVFGQATAGPDGVYRHKVRPGKNRILHAGYRPAPDSSSLTCSRNVRLNVRAGVTLRATKRVRRGGRARFSGRLLGKPIPRVGKLIDLQAFDGGRWRTFKTTRANRTGRYRASYRFTRTTAPRTFRFRARARREARYPYALGTSKVVRVRVR